MNMVTSPQHRLQLIELYIGYFNRAPEQAGLDYWVAQLDSALSRGVSQSAALANIANQFYQAGLQFGLFQASDSTETLIRTVYRNVLGRDEVDPAGLSYWSQRLDSGHTTRGEFVLAVIQGAKDYVAAAPASDPYHWVGDYLANRAAVGEYFASTSGGLTGQDAIQQGRAIIESLVTRDAVQAGQTALDALTDAVRQRQSAAFEVSTTIPGTEPVLPRTAAPVTWLDAQDGGQSYEWSSKTVTVSFPDTIPAEHAADYYFSVGWAPLPQMWRSTLFDIMQDAVAPIGLKLQPVSNGVGDIQVVFGNLPNNIAGWANHPGPGVGGDIQFGAAFDISAAMQPTNYMRLVPVHELGHALGLKHPFEGPSVMPGSLDTQHLSIMSYTYAPDLWPVMHWTYNPSSGIREFSSDLVMGNRADWGLVDLAALAAMYGLNPAYQAGDTIHRLGAPSPQTWLYRTVSDASGNDTLDLRDLTHPSRIDMRPGTLSDADVRTPQDWKQDFTAQAVAYYQQMGVYNASVHDWIVSSVSAAIDSGDVLSRLWSGVKALAIADGTVIENLTLGSADDTVRDNAVNNLIQTGAGNDTIYLGGGGWDRIDGGTGVDVVVLPNLQQASITTLPGSQGAIVTAATYGAVVQNVEYLAAPNGAWFALDATLVGVPPRVPAWSGWSLDDTVAA